MSVREPGQPLVKGLKLRRGTVVGEITRVDQHWVWQGGDVGDEGALWDGRNIDSKDRVWWQPGGHINGCPPLRTRGHPYSGGSASYANRHN